jgi:hypothetical protein
VSQIVEQDSFPSANITLQQHTDPLPPVVNDQEAAASAAHVISLARRSSTPRYFADSTSSQNSREDQVHPTISIPMAAPYEIDAWQSALYEEVDDEPGLRASGPTADTVAMTLLSLLKHHRCGSDFTPPGGVTCDIQPLGSFLNPFHQIEL